MTQTAFDITSARSKNIDLIILLTTVVDMPWQHCLSVIWGILVNMVMVQFFFGKMSKSVMQLISIHF